MGKKVMEREQQGGDPTEVSLLRCRAARDAMAPEEVPPELLALLDSMEGFKEAAEALATAQRALGPPPDLRVPGTMMDDWCTKANRHTGLWRGLVRVLEAGHAALMAGTYMIGPELQMALHKRTLFPFMFSMGGRQLGAINLHIPMWPVQVLQRAAAAFYLHTADPERADKLDPLLMLDKALEGVWPGYTDASPDTISKEARAARQLLASRHWVPALPEPAAADPGSGGSGAAAAAPAAAATPEPLVCTDLGRDVEAALREHCPGTTLQDVRCWFLMLWLEIAGGALIMGLPRAPPVRRLMLIAQQALSSGLLSALEQARVVHVAGKAVYGAQLDAAFVQSPRGEKLVEFVEGGLALAERGRVYVKAAALSRELSMLLLVRSKGEAGEARAASLARIDKLTALRSAWLKECKPWLPAAAMRQLASIDRGLKQQLEEGKNETSTSFMLSMAPDVDTPRCSHCGLQVPHLRACSACRGASYCSRGCQVAHWRAPGGHKSICGQLAAERQGQGSSGGS